MLFRRPAGLAAGLLMLVLAAPAAAAGPANVTVRVEGAAGTLVEESPVRTTLAPVNKTGKPGEACTGTSAAGALELVTGGDWGGTYSSLGYSVERIRSEQYLFDNPNGDFWGFWVNNQATQVGVCGFELQEGDDVVFFVDRCTFDGTRCTNDPVLPLELTVPATAGAGGSVTAKVVRYAPDGSSEPVDRATVTGDGVSATTGPDGTAQITFGRAGTIRLKAEKPGFARSAAEVVAVSGESSAPSPGSPDTPVAKDSAAPVGRILGIRNGRRFSRKRSPRTLRGTVTPDPSGLRAVKLSLTRSHRGRCQLYSPSRERFRPSRCGRRVNFRIGDRQDWSYLLPARLGPGRYVLDVVAVDKAGNRDALARGRSRVVFFVR
jgi:hypothetical protein